MSGKGILEDPIKRAGPAHAVVLAAIHAAAFPPEECWEARIIAGQLSQPGVFGYLHAKGGMVLARLVADEAEILTLAVMQAARRTGVGRALMRRVAEEAGRRGATGLFLEVAVRNAAARALYAALRFDEVGVRRGYYGEGENALTLAAPVDRGEG